MQEERCMQNQQKPRPVPTSMKLETVLAAWNKRKKTRTGEIVVLELARMRTRATAKLNVRLPL